MSSIKCENIGDWGRLYCGDWIEMMRTLPDNSVDSVITDPPAGIFFMGKKWDSDKGGRDKWVAWLTEGMKECLRVLKPGGMALVWSIPRTAHWTATAIEDAGFEIREKLYHLFGSGFPKSTDISKQIDKMKGAEREVIERCRVKGGGTEHINRGNKMQGFRPNEYQKGENILDITIPATPEAQRFSGYGTGLKPSVEEWVLAMKPLDGTFAENAMKHGVAGLNIDGGRIKGAKGDGVWGTNQLSCQSAFNKSPDNRQYKTEQHSQGRWPSNLLLSHSSECCEIGVKKVKGSQLDHECSCKESSQVAFTKKGSSQHGQGYTAPDGTETVPAYECAAGCPCGHVWDTKELTECPECGCRLTEWVCAVKMLDEQAGELKSGGAAGKRKKGPYSDDRTWSVSKTPGIKTEGGLLASSGGPSRYFYCTKSSRTEREQGLKGHISCVKCGGMDTDWHLNEKGEKVKCVRNDHPTKKPLAIMEYLVRLTQSPDGGVVLDPFLGSGTTGVACIKTGRRFIGIDNDPRYVEISRWAMEHVRKRRRGSFNLV